jgi:hypothetical protein
VTCSYFETYMPKFYRKCYLCLRTSVTYLYSLYTEGKGALRAGMGVCRVKIVDSVKIFDFVIALSSYFGLILQWFFELSL